MTSHDSVALARDLAADLSSLGKEIGRAGAELPLTACGGLLRDMNAIADLVADGLFSACTLIRAEADGKPGRQGADAALRLAAAQKRCHAAAEYLGTAVEEIRRALRQAGPTVHRENFPAFRYSRAGRGGAGRLCDCLEAEGAAVDLEGLAELTGQQETVLRALRRCCDPAGQVLACSYSRVPRDAYNSLGRARTAIGQAGTVLKEAAAYAKACHGILAVDVGRARKAGAGAVA